MPVIHERGYLIPAVNTGETDYVSCARALALSIRQWHPDAKICLLTDQPWSDTAFDHVAILPHGDQSTNSAWKLSNDWQAFSATPFRQTIKLEADMLATGPIDHWWTYFENRDVVVSTGCRNLYNQTATSRFYRQVFDNNNLPDVYNAITYWRLSHTAKEFFDWVRRIFENWEQFKTLLKYPDSEPTTDLVYAMAAQIIGPDQCTLPDSPTIVHMKQHIIPTKTSNWTQELIWEDNQPGLRINTVAQWGLVHYHIKDWIQHE